MIILSQRLPTFEPEPEPVFTMHKQETMPGLAQLWLQVPDMGCVPGAARHVSLLGLQAS